MVIDTSVIIAILRREPEAPEFLAKIKADSSRLLSAATLVELQIVCVRRTGVESLPLLEVLLARFEIKIVSFDENQAAIARDAFLRYGKGRHPAGLNSAIA